jgi:hypothetical protein
MLGAWRVGRLSIHRPEPGLRSGIQAAQLFQMESSAFSRRLVRFSSGWGTEFWCRSQPLRPASVVASGKNGRLLPADIKEYSVWHG